METAYFHKRETPDYWLHLLDRGKKTGQIDRKDAVVHNPDFMIDRLTEIKKGMAQVQVGK